MKRFTFALLGGVLVYVSVAAQGPARAAGPASAEEPEGKPATSASTLSPDAMSTMLNDYCVMCHSDAAMTGNLTLESFDATHVEQNAEVAEKMIRKLNAGMMPPAFAPQPEEHERAALTSSLEVRIDEAWAKEPNPGRRSFQRLNRAEYARAVKDLLAVDVDVTVFLPPDTISHSFDNVADVQSMSATLMEGYLRAADQTSRSAVGEPNADAREVTFKLPRIASQMNHVEGAPVGTRGGISVVHNFPADGEYIFKAQLHGTPTGLLFGMTVEGEQLEFSVNGVRMALLDIDPFMSESSEKGLILETEPVFIKAGPQRVSAAFIEKWTGPVDDLVSPIEHTLADTTIGKAYGLTTLPHLRFFSINGPNRVTGVSDTRSRRRVFTCRPTSAADELPCANEIIRRLATQAYRIPLSDSDIEGLMSFYRVGREEGDFESGIRTALQAILANPQFVFRLERPGDAEPGQNYRVSDIELASRLSFFLWSSPPDEELLRLAGEGKLSDPVVLEQQVERMLADIRSEALATRFAVQWLRLQDLERLDPDYLLYPQYDENLADALMRETELFFDNLVREDRSVLELLSADYTFVNERLAQHYRIPNVTGSEFRRVPLDGINSQRRGVLGHGSILTLTSIASRTSPVQRGKWILEVLIGTPPPPPPPNVEGLEVTTDAAEGKVLSVRQAMEMHRANPACHSCHQVIDPLGLALENFDVTGAWRIKDNGNPIDTSGELYDGTPIDGPLGLRDALVSRSDVVVTAFTASLMTYALGRRVEYYDMPAVRQIVREGARNDHRISSFIKGVVSSAAFQMSRAEPIEATDAMEN